MQATCSICRYYYKTRDREIAEDQGVEWEVFGETGICRRYPPVVIMEIRDGDSRRGEEFSVWPEVSADNWCGEYAAVEGDN